MKKLPCMTVKKQEPLAVFQINGMYILGVYQGALSEFDIILKYRQKDTNSLNGWSRIRTPKHIHWAVDVIIKMSHAKLETERFVDFLINLWDTKISPINSIEARDKLLKNDKLLQEVESEANEYISLANKGEYSIKFLLLIAKLLMIQEKTNLSRTYMFKNLLVGLKNGTNLFKIISTATHK